MNDVVNPLSPPAPDFTPPSADVQISQQAREFAQAPGVGPNGEAIPADDRLQVSRLVTAREVLGDKFWEPKSAPTPTAAERAENDRLELIGIRPGASASSYALNLPAGVAPEAADIIRNGVASLDFNPVVGSYFSQRIADLGARFHGMNEHEKSDWTIQQSNKLEQWAKDHGWTDLEAKKADVAAMLKTRKVPELVASIMASDADMAIRLMIHADHLKTVRR